MITPTVEALMQTLRNRIEGESLTATEQAMVYAAISLVCKVRIQELSAGTSNYRKAD